MFLDYKLFKGGNMSLCVYFEVPLTPWGSLKMVVIIIIYCCAVWSGLPFTFSMICCAVSLSCSSLLTLHLHATSIMVIFRIYKALK